LDHFLEFVLELGHVSPGFPGKQYEEDRHNKLVVGGEEGILCEKSFNLKLSGDEVYYTA
jgi:hypothetical protein